MRSSCGAGVSVVTLVVLAALTLGCGPRQEPTATHATPNAGEASNAREDRSTLLTAALGPSLSADCVAPDRPPDARVSLEQAIESVRRELERQPGGKAGGAWELDRADAQVVLCRASPDAAEKSRPFWFIVVPAPWQLGRCGPGVDPTTGIGATCWPATSSHYVDAVDGSPGAGSISGKLGPTMTDQQVALARGYAARFGWWRLWGLLQPHSGQPLPAEVLTEISAGKPAG